MGGVCGRDRWKAGPDVGALAGAEIGLHIRMRSAKPYAFQSAAQQ